MTTSHSKEFNKWPQIKFSWKNFFQVFAAKVFEKKKNKGQIVQSLYVIIFCKLAKVEDVF